MELLWAQPMIHGEDFWEFIGHGLLQSCKQRWRCQCLFPFEYSAKKWTWSLQLYSQGDASECRRTWQSHVNQKTVKPVVHLDFWTVEDTSSLKFLTASLRINFSSFVSPCKIWEGGVVAILPVLNRWCAKHTWAHYLISFSNDSPILYYYSVVL